MTHPDESTTPTPPTATLPAPTPVDPAAAETTTWRRRFDRERTARRDAEALLETAMHDLLLAKQRLDEQHAFLDAILDHADAYFYVKDHNGCFVYVNQKTADLFGREKGDVVGQRHDHLLPPDIAAEFARTDAAIFEHGTTIRTKEQLVHDGRERTFWTIKAPLDGAGGQRHLVGFSTDVSELEALGRELAELALRDSVTGVLNHRAFRGEGQRICHRAHVARTTTSLLLIDVDHFKRINDEHGHDMGDTVLREVAQHMQSHARDRDVFARVGGEEFAFILPDTTLDQATVLAERLVTSTRNLHVHVDDARTAHPTISIGVAACPPEERTLDEALRRADKALYRAKAQGRNRWSEGV